ncbi:MAG: hypothetical protein EPN37_17610 [Chitinophagaceae bacterium]|nr:MAG: hypothetical protein EPN37_17610 [Chitinophagaceae bacterium]
MKKLTLSACVILMLIIASCKNNKSNNSGSTNYSQGTFGYDLSFLKKEDSGLVVLKNGSGSEQVIVSPKYQAKVFTSTANGLDGHSFGWVHYKSFSGPLDPHMNAYGGENRFWLGPEGGVYSLFFKPDSSMVFSHWHTPPPFDSQPWNVVSQNDSSSVTLHKNMALENYRGTELSISIDRKISLLTKASIEQQLQIPANDSVSMVGYETDQTITNTGNFAWDEKTGMPCIWILDMFTPSPNVVIAIPFHPLKDKTKRIATADYFGQIPPDRLIFKDSILYFKADGKSRGKIGLPPYRAKGIEGSYDAANHALTILTADIDPTAKYLYQKWDTTGATFDGDALNAYNDGPLADGSQMGPFYEMESVSPAAFLQSGASLSHRQSVYHFTGSEKALNIISEKLLGVSLDDIKDAFQ